MRFAVADSGLGGLAAAGDLAERLAARRCGPSAEVVFVNVMPSANRGFDAMPDVGERVSVFSAALDGMARRLAPDAIVLACNTLSVLFDRTLFAARGGTPVYGIVEPGVESLREFLAQPRSRAVLFATATTAESGAHAARLASLGIPPDRFEYQACPGMVRAVEVGPGGEAARALADAFVGEALERTGAPDGPLAAALLCTHFPWSADAFAAAFARRGVEAALLDPAPRLVDDVLAGTETGGAGAGGATARVVSKIPLGETCVRAMAPQARKVSPRMADALGNWNHLPELFAVQG